MIRKLSLAFLLVSALASLAWSEDAKEPSLDGVWIAETAELAGNPFPEATTKAIRLELQGENYTVTIGQSVDKGTCKRDDSAQPKALDIAAAEGPKKGKTILAIYELKGDTLQVCYDLSGTKRPTEFKTQEKTQLFLVTYKRKNP